MVSSVLLAVWAVWFVLKDRRKSEEVLRRSRERYRAMLANAADAIVLFDTDLKVLEWNPQATRLYGYGADEVVGAPPPTVGSAEQKELHEILQRLQQKEPVVELATKRLNKSGECMDVAIRVSSFRDIESSQRVFLEMASDLREQIRMRQRALEMEKLTTIGRMAAGTAHTLNTPWAPCCCESKCSGTVWRSTPVWRSWTGSSRARGSVRSLFRSCCNTAGVPIRHCGA